MYMYTCLYIFPTHIILKQPNTCNKCIIEKLDRKLNPEHNVILKKKIKQFLVNHANIIYNRFHQYIVVTKTIKQHTTLIITKIFCHSIY